MYVCYVYVCLASYSVLFFELNLIIGSYLFIYWLHWDAVALCGLSLVTISGGYSLIAM